jgi:hypothetical protein
VWPPWYNKVGTVKNADGVKSMDRRTSGLLWSGTAKACRRMEQRYLVTQKSLMFPTAGPEQKKQAHSDRVTRKRNQSPPGTGRDNRSTLANHARGKTPIPKPRWSEKRCPVPSQLRMPQSRWKNVAVFAILRITSAGRWPMIDVDAPSQEIAQYAEGQRIIAAFVLSEVQDGENKVPQYLVLLNENKDGQPTDYNRLKFLPGT